MAEKSVFTVTDLGGGDGGKGGVVHKICVQKKAHTVVKVGGAQGSHGVRTSRGESFNFSHFGCGTFEGTRTHISDRMVIEPLGLLQEAKRLKFEWGINNVFELMTIDENTLCVTPFHTFTSRLRELSRKNNPKGTVGVGVGEAFLDFENHPDQAILVKDISNLDLFDKLEAIRRQKLQDIEHILNNQSFLLDDQSLADEYISFLKNEGMVRHAGGEFKKMISLVRVVDREYLKKEILSHSGTVVVEASHGVLTDRYYGFHPHTTKLRTVPTGTYEMLEECDYDGNVIRLGVTRAYQIRHGAGPMVTESPDMLDQLLPGSNKDENRWQGKVRVGPLDLVALNYSINVCGGPKNFDGLALTWFDQIQSLGQWNICNRYLGADNPEFFSSNGEILIHHGEGNSQLSHQEKLGEFLKQCSPHVSSYNVPLEMNNDQIIQFCKERLEPSLGIPLRMISIGATEDKKLVF